MAKGLEELLVSFHHLACAVGAKLLKNHLGVGVLLGTNHQPLGHSFKVFVEYYTQGLPETFQRRFTTRLVLKILKPLQRATGRLRLQGK